MNIYVSSLKVKRMQAKWRGLRLGWINVRAFHLPWSLWSMMYMYCWWVNSHGQHRLIQESRNNVGMSWCAQGSYKFHDSLWTWNIIPSVFASDWWFLQSSHHLYITLIFSFQSKIVKLIFISHFGLFTCAHSTLLLEYKYYILHEGNHNA